MFPVFVFVVVVLNSSLSVVGSERVYSICFVN